jgi:ribosome-binding protein aMBF1 (putative translation factor)
MLNSSKEEVRRRQAPERVEWEYEVKAGDIVERVVRLMKDMGMKGKELSTYLGLAQSAVTDWKGGRSCPTLQQVAKMSRLFGVTTDYIIFGGEGNFKA